MKQIQKYNLSAKSGVQRIEDHKLFHSRLVAPDPMERLVVPETCNRPVSTTSISSLCSPERLLVPEILNSPGSPEYRSQHPGSPEYRSQQLAFLSPGGAMESRAHRLSLSPGTPEGFEVARRSPSVASAKL